MEAARLSDEGQKFFETEEPEPAAAEAGERAASAAAELPGGQMRTAETVLCSGVGEVLHEWESKSLELRLRLLEQVEQQAAQLSRLVSVGRFDRLEIQTLEGRVICQVQPDRRLFVRTAGTKASVP
jgi:hypothetical protein